MQRVPSFSHEIWNVYDEAVQNLAKTNNAEGWYRAFHIQAAARHPNIQKFIDCLKMGQNLNEAQTECPSGPETTKEKHAPVIQLNVQKDQWKIQQYKYL